MALSLNYTGLELAHLPDASYMAKLYVTREDGKLTYWRRGKIVRANFGKYYWQMNEFNRYQVWKIGPGKFQF
jgi:hypothetical protein